jgi:two-component system sensor histidine kinase FlrB
MEQESMWPSALAAVRYSPQRAETRRRARCAARGERILQSLPAAVVVLDARGLVEDFNPAALELLHGGGGAGASSLVGQPWSEIVARTFEASDEPIADGDTARLRDGRRVIVLTQPLSPPPGQVVLLLEVPQTTSAAFGAQEVAAVLAHQIRTPLTTAVLHAGRLAQAIPLEIDKRVEIAAKLRRALGHLERLVNEILWLVRGARAPRETLMLGVLIAEFLEIVTPLAQQRGCRLEAPAAVPPLAVTAQRDILLSALENLAVNAIEACGPGGKIEVGVQANGEHIEISIDDDGPGVAAEHAARLFEPFFTTRAGGTGLGLAAVRAAARAHGGEVRYAPRAGGGARFVLTLPVAAPARAADDKGCTTETAA